MSNEDVTLRFNAEGTGNLGAELDLIRQKLAEMPPTVENLSGVLDRLIGIQQRLGQQNQQLARDQGVLREQMELTKRGFEQGRAAAEGNAGAFGILTLAARNLTNPVVLLGVALGVTAGAMVKFTHDAQAAVREAQTLQALTGQSLKDAQLLAGGFERAGVSVSGLQMMLNRLGFELEQGGHGLVEYGFTLEEIARVADRPGAALRMIRDRLSEISDASTRAGAIRDLFGRYAGVEAARAFTFKPEEMERFFAAAARAKDVEEALVVKSLDLAQAQKDVVDRSRALALTFAELVGIPVQRWLIGVTEALLALRRAGAPPGEGGPTDEDFLTRLARQAGEARRRFNIAQELANQPRGAREGLLAAGLRRSLGGAFIDEETAAGIDASRRQAAAQEEYAKIIKARKDREREEDARAEEANKGRLREQDRRYNQEAINADIERQQKRLAGEAEYLGELGRLREDSTAEAIRQQIRLTEEEDRLARQRYERLLAVEQDAARKAPGGQVRPEVTAALEKARDDVLVANEERRRTLRLKLASDEIADERARLDAILQLEKTASDQRIAITEQDAQRRLAVLRAVGANEIEITLETSRIELETARRVTEEKIRQNEQERAATERIMDQKVAAGISPRQEQLQLADLARQRIQVEEELATKVVQARTKMVDDLDKLARREAQIGQQAIDLAQRRLDLERQQEAAALSKEAARLRAIGDREARQAARAEIEELETMDPDEARRRRRQMRIEDLDRQAREVSERPIESTWQGLAEALGREFREVMERFASSLQGGALTADERGRIGAMAGLRGGMAELGTQAPGLALLQQLASQLMGRNDKFAPTALQGAFPAGSAGAMLSGAPPAGSVLAGLLGGSGAPTGGGAQPPPPGGPSRWEYAQRTGGSSGGFLTPEESLRRVDLQNEIAAGGDAKDVANAWAEAKRAAEAAWSGGAGTGIAPTQQPTPQAVSRTDEGTYTNLVGAADKMAAAVERFVASQQSAGPIGGGGPGPSLSDDAGALGSAYQGAFATAAAAADGFIASMRAKLTEAQRDVIESLYREIKEKMFADAGWEASRR